MKLKHFFIGFLLLPIFGCNAAGKNIISETCSSKREVLNFDDFCDRPDSPSKLSSGQWKSWTLFKSSCNGDNYTHAGIGVVSVGWWGVSVGMDTIQLDATWANKNIDYAVELSTPNGSVTGKFISDYTMGKPALREYFKSKMIFDENGKYEKEWFGANSSKVEDISLIPKNRVVGAESYAVNLLIKDLASGNIIRLEGPSLKNFTDRLEAGKPETVGFLKVINPFSKKSVWQLLKSASKCDKIYEQYRSIFNSRISKP